MRETWIAIFLAFFLQVSPGRAQHTSSSLSPENASGGGPCKAVLLPLEVRQHIRQEFRTWTIADVSGLSDPVRERWKSEKPVGCPGIASGFFEGANRSFAVLLVPGAPEENGYRLLVFTRMDQRTYEPTIVDQSNDAKWSNLFIHAVKMSQFFNEQSKKKFHAFGSEGILLADVGQNEYETDVYFWADGKYQHQPVDY
jgi:hypothetical protein